MGSGNFACVREEIGHSLGCRQSESHLMSDDVLARHKVAEQIAAAAAALALEFFSRRSELVAETKASPQDVVSRADREVEDLIRDRISKLFPGDGLLGEEHGLATGKSGFTWVIDPIDGTSPFLAGLPHWCVAIAIVQEEETVAAVTHVPMANEVFSTRKNSGAWLNGRKLLLDGQLTMQNSLTGLGANHRSSPLHVADVLRGVLEAGGAFYRNGSGAIMLASVSAGRLGAYYEPYMNSWDCLGGLLMVREAGGTTLPFGSSRNLLKGGPVLAAAASVWTSITGIVSAAGD